MTAIRDLLSRARLVEHPTTPLDIVPCETEPQMPAWDDGSLWNATPPSCSSSRAHAAQDLNILCEVMVARTFFLLCEDFITERLPAPQCARLIGCILQLTDAEDHARFWWQYAAGAGDETASYCLHLHHLSLGESEAATLWNTLADSTPQPGQGSTFPERIDGEWNIPTMLRLLTTLTANRQHHRAAVVEAVLDYVPDAVAAGHDASPDLDIPLPKPGFTDQIKAILNATARGTARRSPHKPDLPGRPAVARSTGLRVAGA